jgi:hypothetical protein
MSPLCRPASPGSNTPKDWNVQTVESGGFPAGNSDGVGKNWMTILRKHERLKKVFWIDRDRLLKVEPVKIAPVRKGCGAKTG